jgi:hypothetical protein
MLKKPGRSHTLSNDSFLSHESLSFPDKLWHRFHCNPPKNKKASTLCVALIIQINTASTSLSFSITMIWKSSYSHQPGLEEINKSTHCASPRLRLALKVSLSLSLWVLIQESPSEGLGPSCREYYWVVSVRLSSQVRMQVPQIRGTCILGLLLSPESWWLPQQMGTSSVPKSSLPSHSLQPANPAQRDRVEQRWGRSAAFGVAHTHEAARCRQGPEMLTMELGCGTSTRTLRMSSATFGLFVCVWWN